MKIKRCLSAVMLTAAQIVVIPGMAASAPTGTGVPAQMVITVLPVHQSLHAADVMVTESKTSVPVVGLQRLAGDSAEMQLFVLLDDSTRSSSLGLQLPDLKKFVNSLPPTTQVAIGYMRNGTFALSQAFTADHQIAAKALRLPQAIPGENGSPYFVLSDLAKHWPSKQATGRRAVLILTDGVDRYYESDVLDDPYVDSAAHDALKNGIAVYSIYLRGAGFYGRGRWSTSIAQSRLTQVSEETGGHAYFETLTDPVTIVPFLSDFQNRLANQYKVTIEALNDRGVHPVKLRTELPGLKIEGPSRIYVQ